MFKQSLLVLSAIFYSVTTLADDSVAKIIKVQGEATAVNAKNETRALVRGADIFAQDTVVTPPTGFATLRFSDGTVIDLAASSKFVVHDYHFNQADPKKDKFSSEIVEGGFRAITGTIGSRSPSAFDSKARLTTLTVRGTYFYFLAPECPHHKKEQPNFICYDVTEFTLKGQTALNYQGTDYMTGEGQPNATFDLVNGVVTLSNTIPTNFPVVFDTTSDQFSQTYGSLGGGGASDPCGTLNAVGNALPNTK